MAKISINIATGSLQKEDIIVGIDLGTTNSLIAIIHPETKKAICLKEHNLNTIVPSIVYFNAENSIVVGEEAEKMLELEPENTIYSAKRLMGKSYNEIKENDLILNYTVIDENADSLAKVKVKNKFYSPIELSSFILRELKNRAEHILKTTVSKAVITVPAYFNDTQRQATRDAGKLAGLDVLRIINEPTAASLAYGIGIDTEIEKTIAVYDLGGGTFDVSILKIQNGIFEVLSTNGNTLLGGDDFDKKIIEYWCEQNENFELAFNTNSGFKQSIRLIAKEAKTYLSLNEKFSKQFENFSLELDKNKFESLIDPLINLTIDCCKNAMKDAGILLSEINSVLMVGGSTRVPIVKEKVSKYFDQKVNDTINPDEVVALGAAIQADILAGNNQDLLLLDITPLSLGIETMGGLMDVLIPRNTKIPFKVARQYTTQKDGQGSIRVSVFQGERDLVKDNRKLAEFNLSGIPGMPAGLPKIEVSFLINADGILTVSAKELRSGVCQSIELKPQNGISDSDVEKMLEDSILNAKNDIILRALTETKTEAILLLSTTENFLQKNNQIISSSELFETAQAMQNLQMALTLEDKDLIQSKIEILNNITQPFAERAMDIAVSSALSGKSII